MSIGWLALLCAVWCIGHNQGQEDAMSYKNERNYILVINDPYRYKETYHLWFHTEDSESNCDIK